MCNNDYNSHESKDVTCILILHFHSEHGFLQIQHSGGFLVWCNLMITFCVCANTPVVSFVENNDDNKEEWTTHLDLGLPVEAQVIR